MYKYRLLNGFAWFRAPDGVGSAGANGSAAPVNAPDGGVQRTGATPDNAVGAGKPNEPEPKNFLDRHEGLWNDPVREPIDQDAAEAAATARRTRQETNLTNYANSFDPEISISAEEVEKFMNDKDPAGLIAAVKKTNQALLRRVATDTGTMITEAMDAMRAEFQTAARNQVKVSDAEKSLVAAFPKLTSKPAVRPVCVALKSKLLGMGKSDKEANEGVREFLREMATEGADDLGLNIAPEDEPGRNNGLGSRQQQRARTEKYDWVEIMNGRS